MTLSIDILLIDLLILFIYEIRAYMRYTCIHAQCSSFHVRTCIHREKFFKQRQYHCVLNFRIISILNKNKFKFDGISVYS